MRVAFLVAVCVLAGLAVGWLAGRFGGRITGGTGGHALGLGLAAGTGIGALLLILSARSAPGMEGLARVTLGLILVAPLAAGMAAGTLLGARARRR